MALRTQDIQSEVSYCHHYLNRIGMPNFWSGLHQNISRFRFLEHVDLVGTYLPNSRFAVFRKLL